ncbi:MAG: dTDP-4-dehydrorhamnose 3,5-epimerase family protein [Myxococcota bacterium]|nr:dTDP-4-dehydrorhamnose 3,5-epimerase family protein [Myxococcota bacterium]
MMRFEALPIEGCARVIQPRHADSRGHFGRIYCRDQFSQELPEVVQVNHSFSAANHTLRGLHYQIPPHGESKLVRCLRGRMYDVILDMRPNSKTFGKWAAEILDGDDRKMILIAPGVSHGFMTMAPNTELMYMVSAAYAQESERGVRYNDPAFEIQWPATPAVISPKDAGLPDYDPLKHWPLVLG